MSDSNDFAKIISGQRTKKKDAAVKATRRSGNVIWNDELPGRLIDHMKEGFTFDSFGKKIGSGKTILYRWVEEHPEWKIAKEIGEVAAQYYWEQVGKKGINGEIVRFSVPGWIFLMKNRFQWRDDQGEKAASAPGQLTPGMLLELIKMARAEKDQESLPRPVRDVNE